MGIAQMKTYLALCLEGAGSIPARRLILEEKRRDLEDKLDEIQGCIAYIDTKQRFYQEVLAGKTPYVSNLLPEDRPEP